MGTARPPGPPLPDSPAASLDGTSSGVAGADTEAAGGNGAAADSQDDADAANEVDSLPPRPLPPPTTSPPTLPLKPRTPPPADTPRLSAPSGGLLLNRPGLPALCGGMGGDCALSRPPTSAAGVKAEAWASAAAAAAVAAAAEAVAAAEEVTAAAADAAAASRPPLSAERGGARGAGSLGVSARSPPQKLPPPPAPPPPPLTPPPPPPPLPPAAFATRCTMWVACGGAPRAQHMWVVRGNKMVRSIS